MKTTRKNNNQSKDEESISGHYSDISDFDIESNSDKNSDISDSDSDKEIKSDKISGISDEYS